MVKLPPSLTTRTRAPIISVPPFAPKRHSASQKAAPPPPHTTASPRSVRTGNRGHLYSIDVHQDSAFSSFRAPWGVVPLLANLLTSRLYIVGEQEVRRKTARGQRNQGYPLTDHKGVLMTFERSTKVLYSLCLY